MYLFYYKNVFILLIKYFSFSFYLTIRKNSCLRVRGKEFVRKIFFDTIEKHGGHVWHTSIYIILSLHLLLFLLAPSFYPCCLYNYTWNIFIHAPMYRPFPFFFNLKHRINHELSFRVVSEERYASRRNSPARVFRRLSAPETVAASILLPLPRPSLWEDRLYFHNNEIYLSLKRRRPILTRYGPFRKWVAPGLRLGCKKTKKEEDAQTRT